jgi:hypothetical protein
MRNVKLLAVLFQCACPAILLGAETTAYAYDDLGRLVQVSNSGGPRNGNTNSTRYDPAGNRQALAVNQALPPPSSNASSVSVSNAAPVSGGQSAVFGVVRSGTAASVLSVNYATANGTAASPSNYTAVSGTLTFQTWETAKSVSVSTIVPSGSVPPKQFSLVLSSPSSGLTIGTGTATATIAGSSGPPIANDDTATAGICQNTTINVLANDTDPGGNVPLTLVSVTGGNGNGTATVVSNMVRYHANGATGADFFTYTVKNTLNLTATASLSINLVDNGGCL